MNKKLILIAGIPASGKTSCGLRIAKKFNVPFFSKDHFKERLHDALKWDNTVRANSKLYGGAAYDMALHAAERTMAAGAPLMLESNFRPENAVDIAEMVSRHNYEALTVLFDADIKTLHRRFIGRDETEERHPGLISGGLKHADFTLENFEAGCAPLRKFRVGELVIVDTTDFDSVDYGALDGRIENFLRKRAEVGVVFGEAVGVKARDVVVP